MFTHVEKKMKKPMRKATIPASNSSVSCTLPKWTIDTILRRLSILVKIPDLAEGFGPTCGDLHFENNYLVALSIEGK